MKILGWFRKNRQGAQNAQGKGKSSAGQANAQIEGDIPPAVTKAQERTKAEQEQRTEKFNQAAINQAQPLPNKKPGVFREGEIIVLHGRILKVKKITQKDVVLRRVLRTETKSKE